MPPHNQEDDKETITGDDIANDNNSTSTPDHWPVIKADDTPTNKLFRSITPSGDGEIQLMQSLTAFTATATPLYFYSINTLLHQQDEECWENTESNDEVDTADISLTELIEDKNITIPQSKKSILSSQREKKNCNTPQKKSVCFPIEEDLITATHTRPRTSDIDIPTLYYTDDEIRHFKDTYRNEMKIEKLREFRRRTKLIFDEIDRSRWL